MVEAGADEVAVRDVDGPEEMSDCVALYSRVMGLDPGDGSLNPRLLIALQHNSGIVVGAYERRDLVGFAYGFLARDPNGSLYEYSQLAVVDAARQDHGIGRQLKHAQRERCLAAGIMTMRWVFDPLKARNAHFNLDVLGARLVALVPSMYGSEGFGADRGDDTDRFVTEWDLTRRPRPASRVPVERAWSIGETRRDHGDLLVAVPARWSGYRAQLDPTEAAATRHKLREVFQSALLSGLIGVSCRAINEEIAVYRFASTGPSAVGVGQ